MLFDLWRHPEPFRPATQAALLFFLFRTQLAFEFVY
jgi:hypothetical protein